MSRALPVKIGVHFVFEGWRFAFSLACRYGGGVSWVVKQTGGREALSLRWLVPVSVHGCRGRGRRQRQGGCRGA